jgi:hypothetical protein
MTWIVCKAEEGDIRSPFEQVLSVPQRHVRPTLRSRKSTFVGLGLIGKVHPRHAYYAKSLCSYMRWPTTPVCS